MSFELFYTTDFRVSLTLEKIIRNSFILGLFSFQFFATPYLLYTLALAFHSLVVR